MGERKQNGGLSIIFCLYAVVFLLFCPYIDWTDPFSKRKDTKNVVEIVVKSYWLTTNTVKSSKTVLTRGSYLSRVCQVFVPGAYPILGAGLLITSLSVLLAVSTHTARKRGVSSSFACHRRGSYEAPNAQYTFFNKKAFFFFFFFFFKPAWSSAISSKLHKNHQQNDLECMQEEEKEDEEETPFFITFLKQWFYKHSA